MKTYKTKLGNEVLMIAEPERGVKIGYGFVYQPAWGQINSRSIVGVTSSGRIIRIGQLNQSGYVRRTTREHGNGWQAVKQMLTPDVIQNAVNHFWPSGKEQ